MDKVEAAISVSNEYPLFFLEENESQRKFVHIKNSKGETPKRRLFEAGNKCLTAETFVDTLYGPVKMGCLKDKGWCATGTWLVVITNVLAGQQIVDTMQLRQVN